MATPPGAPTGLTASAWLPAGTGLTLSWTAPIVTGTTNGTTPATISSYTITYATDAGFTAPLTITAVTGLTRAITGLTAGTNYWFQMKAVNSASQTGPNSSAVATATLAAAPTIGAVSVASATSVTVNWTAPTNNSGITSYTVTPSSGSATTGLTGTSATITGLTQGTSYTFTVRAVTAQGTSAASAASAAIVPSTAPGAATNLAAIPTTTSISLSWAAPGSNGGGLLAVNYKIERSTDNSSWSTLVASQTARTYTNNLLANLQPIPVIGTNYWYRVTSFNIPTVGATQSSSPTAALATATLPAAPTIGAVSVAGVNSINVAWTAPAGNPAITSYTVTPFIGTVAQTATTGLLSSPATITGLTKGTPYTFKVAAVTLGGTGAVSAASAAATPSTAPSAATNLAVTTVTTTSIALSWTAPSDTGGLTVNYKIERSLDNSTWATLVASQTAITFTNSVIVNAQPALVAGTNYWYRVTPFNIPTTGAIQSGSTTDALATNTLPAAPTAVTAVSTSNTSASVSFVAPTGNTTKSYTVTPFIGAVAQTATTDITASPALITGLINSTTTYTFKVTAVSTSGSSAASTASAIFVMAMVPDQVLGVTATPLSSTTVRLDWPAAPANNGAAMTYRVEYSANGGSSWVPVSSTISAAVLTYTVASLTTNLVYQFRVSALNVKGVGAPSSVVTSSSLPATPATPTVAVTGPNTANITFTSIAGLSYNIVPLLSGSSAQTTISVGPATGVSTTAPVTLSNSYGCYKFKIQAVNSYGVSAAYSANSAMAYFGSSVAAPGGNAYLYDGASYVIGTSTVSYTDTLMAAATVVPTTVGGAPGWSVTAGGATDTLIGVKRVVFSDQSAYLFGSGSAGSIDSMNNLSATMQAAGAGTPGGKSGDVFLFSRGETYTRNNVSEWYIDLSGIAIKGVGDSSLAKPILVFNNTVGWPAHIMEYVNGVTLQDLQISGGNKTRNFNLLKVGGSSNPLGLVSNVTFTGVDFINVGSKSIDFHYVHGITMTDCIFGAATNDKTLTFSACHDVVMANCTVERSAWNSVSILTSDGPNYLWTNNTSALWNATEAERLDALNNKNFDFSTSTFNSDANGNLPLIIFDLLRFVTISYSPRVGLPANVTNLADATSLYQLSMSYTGVSPSLKLPGSMSVAYSGMNALYTGFQSPVVRFTSSTSYSSALLRDSQWAPAAYPVVQVTDLSTGERLYPDGFPRTPAEVIADQEELIAAAVAAGSNSLPIEVGGSQVEAPFVLKNNLEADTAVAAAAEGAPLLVKDGTTLVPAIKTDVSTDSYNGATADAKLATAMQKAVTNGMSSIVVTRIRPGAAAPTTSLLALGTPAADLTVVTEDSTKQSTFKLTTATVAGVPMDLAKTIVTSEITPRTDGVVGANLLLKVAVNGVTVTTGFSIPITIQDQSAAGAAAYVLSHWDGAAYTQVATLLPSATAGNNYTFVGTLTENQDYRGVQAGAPSAPAKPTTVSHDTSITVMFSAPNSNNSNITDYHVYWSGDDGSSGDALVGSASATSYEVTGLTDGVNYTFLVAAINSVGEGADSPASDPAQSVSTPSAPTITRPVTAGNESLTVAWSAPANAAHADILGYYLYYLDTSDTEATQVKSSLITLTSSALTGLTNGHVYSVWVTATSNQTGEGASSTVVTGCIPLGSPTVPSLSAAVGPGAGQVTLSITPPTNYGDNGANLAALTYSVYQDYDPIDNPLPIETGVATPYTVSGLISGMSYMFRVSASNGVSASNISTAASVTAIGMPGLPDLLVSPGDYQVTLTISPSTDFGGDSSVTYALTRDETSLPLDGLTYTDTGLMTATARVYRLTVSNSLSSNSLSVSATPDIPASSENNYTKPGTPSISAVAGPGVGQITLTITPSTNFGGAPSVIYTVYNLVTGSTVVSGGSALTYSESDLTIGTSYRYSVFARNVRFPSDESNETTATPLGPQPSAGPVCFLANAPVLTPRGYCRIDSLKAGDRVRLADGSSMEIKTVKVVRYQPSAEVNPFVIPKGSFGAKERLLISPSHRVAVPGRGMVEARNLGLKQWTMHEAFDYYNLELEKWENMVVAGVEVESLAPVRRTIITTAQLKQLLRAKYGARASESELLSKIPSSFFSLGNGLVSIPYIKK